VLISVLIVNWNGASLLRSCLDALKNQTFKDFEIILIDNGSTDDSATMVIDNYPEVQLIVLPENRGFAGGNNLAAGEAKGEWLVLLNNDVIAESSWLATLAVAAESNKGFAGFASCQLSYEDPEILDGAGDDYHCSGRVWRRGVGERFGPPWNEKMEVFSPCGATAMYKKDIFMSCGGFDEDFFCYLEDVDLGFRLRLLGHRFLYVPEARVRHVGSASKGRGSDFARYFGHRNLVWTFFKNMPSALFWRYLVLHLFLNLMSVLFFSVQGQGGTIFKAKWHALKALPSVFQKRRQIQADIRVDTQQIEEIFAYGLGGLFWGHKTLKGVAPKGLS